MKQTPTEWAETARDIGLNDEQTLAVVGVMQFIRELDEAELDEDKQQLIVISMHVYVFKIGRLFRVFTFRNR